MVGNRKCFNYSRSMAMSRGMGISECHNKLKTVFFRLGLWLVILLGAQSCTTLNNVFYWADTYLAWEIDEYFDLTKEQEIYVAQHLDMILLAYKEQEIPKYIAFLQEIKIRSQVNLTLDDIEWFRNTLRQFNVNIANLLVDDVTYFLAGLENGQIPYFEQKLAESNEDWLEKREKRNGKSDEEKLEKRYKDIEEWMGDLSKEQKEKIALLSKQYESPGENRYNRRLQSQQRFITLLKTELENQNLRELLLDWYLNSDRHNTEESKEFSQRRNLNSAQLFLMLDRTATEKQRAFFYKKLDSYIEQLEKIING